MATLGILEQDIFDNKSGRFLVQTRVKIASSSDSVEVPEGLDNASHVAVIPVDPDNTAPTVSSITQAAYPQANTVNLSGGTKGAEMLVISLHLGSAAGL